MTARHLRIFVEIYQTGSVTKAAQNLFLTQPTVTRALRETEEYYGVQLFERAGQGRGLVRGDAARDPEQDCLSL